MAKRAILSVYDKRGLVDLARGLIDLGWELVASGGSARAVREAGLSVTKVADVTGARKSSGGVSRRCTRLSTVASWLAISLLIRPIW